jgi:hypothetical protein
LQRLVVAAIDVTICVGMGLSYALKLVAVLTTYGVSLQGNYDVYTDLENADVRIFMPAKQHDNGTAAGFPTLHERGKLGTTSGLWKLPDDNAGIDRIGRNHATMTQAIMLNYLAYLLAGFTVVSCSLMAVLRVALVNRRLGVTLSAFTSSFQVNKYQVCRKRPPHSCASLSSPLALLRALLLSSSSTSLASS